jgi:hypothetical protein
MATSCQQRYRLKLSCSPLGFFIYFFTLANFYEFFVIIYFYFLNFFHYLSSFYECVPKL